MSCFSNNLEHLKKRNITAKVTHSGLDNEPGRRTQPKDSSPTFPTRPRETGHKFIETAVSSPVSHGQRGSLITQHPHPSLGLVFLLCVLV